MRSISSPFNFSQKTLDEFLNGLMRRYAERVPDVKRVFRLLEKHGLISDPSEIENDHIAFRTLGIRHLGIQSLAKIFLHCGYQRMDRYHFEHKRLDAHWYAPPADRYPRVFISELRVGELSHGAQAILGKYTEAIQSDPVDELDLDSGEQIDRFLHQPLWQRPTWGDYQQLGEESEYAAWVLYNRYYLNHFTISVHNLPSPYNDLAKFNELLEDEGLQLNDSGDKIKTSPDDLLLQSSTVAQMLDSEFDDGQGGTEWHRISGSYVEFAERRVLPQYASLPAEQIRRHHRRDGFEAGNADKIFESTFNAQTGRRSSE